MSELAENLKSRCKALGWSQARLSKEILSVTGDRVSQQTIAGIETGEHLHTRYLPQIARALGVKADDLDPAYSGTTSDQGMSDVRQADIVPPRLTEMERDVPVMGTAAGSEQGSFHFEGGVVDYVRRPPALIAARDAYAIFVTGDSMEPVHPQGELRFVHPGRQPRSGDSVLIQLQEQDDGSVECFIKILKKRAGGQIVTEQLNPAKDLKFDDAKVLYIHKVLTMNELFGV